MTTKQLAKELGLLRQRSKSSNGSKKSPLSNQTFSYLIVIDFESTCWKEKNNYGQEIIEFPAVLLNTSTGEVESEFHTYVQPQEHPVLSEFCTELTGITQTQVEAGIPLQICLSRFSRWLQNLQLEKGVIFPNKLQKSSASTSPSPTLCTFVTWSDWDLGVCLQYECKRKQLYKPDVLNSWIDLRSTYRMFYDRKPKGLNGALQDLGIQFSGREHSGLDDARNTAHLAARMMRDGCVMKITRSLVKTPAFGKSMCGNTTADNKKEQTYRNREERTNSIDKPSTSKILPKSSHMKSSVENTTKGSDTKENSSPVCQSLISPNTVLNGTTTPVLGHSRRSEAAVTVSNISSSVVINSPQNNNISLALCSTTVGCLSNLPQLSNMAAVGASEGEEVEELFVETEDRCGSYDDVVLGGDVELMSETEGVFDTEYVAGLEGKYHVWEEPDNTLLAVGQNDKIEGTRCFNNFKSQKMQSESLKTSICKNNRVVFKPGRQNSSTSESNFVFLAPKPPDSRSNRHQTGAKPSLRAQARLNITSEITNTNTPVPFRHKSFITAKTSTPNPSLAKPKPVTTKLTKHTPQSSFTIYTDLEKPSCSSMSGSSASKSVLSSLSINTSSSRMNQSLISGTSKGGQKITSPLCACGRRAKRQVVSNGGPNHGRGFYCCSVRRSGSGGSIKKGCEFFKWESALMKGSSVNSPAYRSSVSLCQMNSTLICGPPQRSTIRKSC